MAFSTQKDFLKIGFLDDKLDPICHPKACVRVKSYSSTADLRTFTMDPEKQAHFINDLVACRTYLEVSTDKPGGKGGNSKPKKAAKKKTKKTASPLPAKKSCPSQTVPTAPKFKRCDTCNTKRSEQMPTCAEPHNKPHEEIYPHSAPSSVGTAVSTMPSTTCSYLVEPKNKGVPVTPVAKSNASTKSANTATSGGTTMKSANTATSGADTKKSDVGSAAPPPCALAKASSEAAKSKAPTPAPSNAPSQKNQASLDGGKTCGANKSGKDDGKSEEKPEKGGVRNASTKTGDYCNMISTVQFCTVDNMVNENVKLREKLRISEDALRSIRTENTRIKKIVETDRSCLPLIEKIFELKEDKKISSKDEKDLLKIEKQICSRIKKLDILEAENYSLRQKIEKLSDYNHESSYDPDCLRDCIYELEEEVKRLRAELINAKCGSTNKNDDLLLKLQSIQCEYDAHREQLKKSVDMDEYNNVIQERDKLREQINRMGNLEGKILKLKQRAVDADRLENELRRIQYGSLSAVQSISYEAKHQMVNIEKLLAENEDLRRKVAYLEADCMECIKSRRVMNDLQTQIDSLKNVKIKNKELMSELRNAGSYLQRMNGIEEELFVTKGELASKERIIKDYECQFNQLLQVIEELEGSDYSNKAIKDCHMKEVALATKATLEQIKLELEARGELQKTLKHTREASEIQICSLCGQLEQYKKANMMMRQAFITVQDNFYNILKDIGYNIQGSSMAPDIFKNDDENLIEIIHDKEVDQICNELERLKSEIFDERKKYENEKLNLIRAGKDFETIKDKLDEESDKYRLQREKCKDLTKENLSLGSELDELQRKFAQNRDALERQKSALEEQKDLLAEAKAELEKHRSDICKCNEKISSLETECINLNQEKEDLLSNLNVSEKQVLELEDKVKALNFELNDYKDKVQEDSCLAEELQNLKVEFECCKCEIDQTKEDLKSKDIELQAAHEKAEEAQFCLEKAKKEFCNKMATLLEDNKILEMELMKSREDLDEMNKIICEIESEKNKTKLLEVKLTEFDHQLKNAGQPIVPSQYHPNIAHNIDTLKRALEDEEGTIRSLYEELGKHKDKLKQMKVDYESEINRNEKLTNELTKIKEELRIHKSSNEGNANEFCKLKEDYETETQKNSKLESSIKKEKTLKEQLLLDLNKVKADFKKEILKGQDVTSKFSAMIQNLTKEKDKSLARLQNIHDEQVKELKSNHIRELHLLRLANSKPKGSTPSSPTTPLRLPPARKGLIEIPEKTSVTNRSLKSERIQKSENTYSPRKSSRIKSAESRKNMVRLDKSEKNVPMAKLEEVERDDAEDKPTSITRKPAKTILKDNAKFNEEKISEGKNLINSITDIQVQSIKKVEDENIKPIYCETTKLQYICQKIIDHGIESLNLKELTYIHSEIYKAGLKYKSQLTAYNAQQDKDKRCCKCSGFTCCLPDIPKEKEKKFVDRIMSLENEVQWARNVLQKIIQNEDRGQPSSSRRDDSTVRRISSDRLTEPQQNYNFVFENRLPETWSVTTPKNRRWFDYPTKER